MTLRFPIVPMKATLGSLPPTSQDDRWAYEIKWDGHRTIVHVADGRARVWSAGGHDVGDRWPEVLDIVGSVNADEAVLDGEIVVLGPDGLPSFDLVQRRHGRGRAAGPNEAEPGGHVMFHAFDVLAIDGTETTTLPYLDRRRLLTALLETGPNWTVPEHRVGGGAELVEATANLGLEGVVAKRVESTYRVGSRTKDWRKIKHRRIVELPIGGFTAGTGNRSSTFGSLLLGHPPDSEGAALRFAGGVGTGFDTATLDELAGRLRDLTTTECPFDPPPPRPIARTATWVAPALTARVEIAEFTNDGHVRHASFLSLTTPSDER